MSPDKAVCVIKPFSEARYLQLGEAQLPAEMEPRLSDEENYSFPPRLLLLFLLFSG